MTSTMRPSVRPTTDTIVKPTPASRLVSEPRATLQPATGQRGE